jgi:hypothetical protein
MAKYPMLIKTVDIPPFWYDTEHSTSGDALTHLETMLVSGAIIEAKDNSKIIRINGENITTIELYFPV